MRVSGIEINKIVEFFLFYTLELHDETVVAWPTPDEYAKDVDIVKSKSFIISKSAAILGEMHADNQTILLFFFIDIELENLYARYSGISPPVFRKNEVSYRCFLFFMKLIGWL
jgi:hypothetical protein